MRSLTLRTALWMAGLFVLPAVHAQNWGQVAGQVTSGGESVPGATILVASTSFGTVADADGRFSMRIPTGRYLLRVTAIGYRTVQDSVEVRRDRVALFNVRMRSEETELREVTVTSDRVESAGVYAMRPEDVQNLPGPFRSAFQAVRVLPGVAANNELSNQFSVRGGGLSENLIFLNGFEVFLPFRPKQGEQEGLGILNPDLTETLTLYAGGFPARYGGKLSSALDVRYVRPEAGLWHGNASASLLDASVATSGRAGRVGVTAGLRHAQPGRFFGTQELQGDYKPSFTDAQAVIDVPLSNTVRVEAVGLVTAHRFNLEPSTLQTTFGYVSGRPDRPDNLQRLYTVFEGEERDGFNTRFGGLRLSARPSTRFTADHDVSVYDTEEFEQTAISGDVQLSQIVQGQAIPSGAGIAVDSSDNRIRVRALTGQGRYVLTAGAHALEAGWMLRALRFDDRIFERAYSKQPNQPQRIEKDNDDALQLDEQQQAVFAQDAFDVMPSTPGRLTATLGVRADHFTFNDEWTVSPRLGLRYRYSDVTTLTGSAGVYYQAPSYQEFRADLATDGSIAGALNRDLQAQRALQVVAGGEHFLTEKRLWVRAEAYYKKLDRLISYDVNNVRVRYSGLNDSYGYVGGFDVQVRGEFVPGLESWFNYGFLTAQEHFLAQYENKSKQGWIARPTDQRHTFSLFIQDYIPGDKSWRLHLRALYGSGYPYSPLVPVSGSASSAFLGPGKRNVFRYDAYKRLDAGVTKILEFGKTRLDVTAELLNGFDMTNEVGSRWVFGGDKWNRVPIRLTPRTFNVRARLLW